MEILVGWYSCVSAILGNIRPPKTLADGTAVDSED